MCVVHSFEELENSQDKVDRVVHNFLHSATSIIQLEQKQP